MSNNHKIFAIVVVLIVFGIGVVLLMDTGDKDETSYNSYQSEPALSTEKTTTVATQWQWEETQKPLTSVPTTNSNGVKLPFTVESIYTALQAVKFDESGNIILDHDALISLDEALERIHNQLDSDSLALLQTIIRQALPGVSGAQTAQIVGDYYFYLEAKEEFSKMDQVLSEDYVEPTLDTLQNDQATYAELQALREAHLGSEATASLFRVSDANAQFMFETMKLGLDSSLTSEQIQQKSQQIQEQHLAQSINVVDWPARYQGFLAAKQNIVAASIDDQQKRAQVAQLLQQHFTQDELKRISHLGLEAL